MINSNPDYRRYIFMAMIIIALGVTFSTTMQGIGSLGIVFIAVGGLFFIIGMSKKRQEQIEDGSNREDPGQDSGR